MNKTEDYMAKAPVAGILLLAASAVVLVLFVAGCLAIWAVRRASRRPTSRPGCLALGMGAARWARAARDFHGANQIGLVVHLSKKFPLNTCTLPSPGSRPGTSVAAGPSQSKHARAVPRGPSRNSSHGNDASRTKSAAGLLRARADGSCRAGQGRFAYIWHNL